MESLKRELTHKGQEGKTLAEEAVIVLRELREKSHVCTVAKVKRQEARVPGKRELESVSSCRSMKPTLATIAAAERQSCGASPYLYLRNTSAAG